MELFTLYKILECLLFKKLTLQKRWPKKLKIGGVMCVFYGYRANL